MPTLIYSLFLFSGLSLAGPPADAPEAPMSPSVVEELMEREADILARVQEHRPEKYDELLALKDEDPDAYTRRLFKIARSLRQMRSNPELREVKRAQHELMGGLEELAAEYQTAGKKEQRTLREKMTEVAGEIFELRQQERRMKVEEMAAHLEALQSEIAERDDRKDELIEEYLDRMLADEPEGL